jgi:hypothetical protein
MMESDKKTFLDGRADTPSSQRLATATAETVVLLA